MRCFIPVFARPGGDLQRHAQGNGGVHFALDDLAYLRQLPGRDLHDELVVEVAPGELTEVREIVEREMDSAITLRVPLEVSAGTGENWDEAAH